MFIPPLLLLPLIIYNLVAFDIVGSGLLLWAQPLFSLSMPSGAVWSMSVADLIVVIALLLLMIDVARSRYMVRKGSNLFASFSVLAVYAVEFALVPAAATSVFFACLVMSFVDLVVRLITPAKPRPITLPDFEE